MDNRQMITTWSRWGDSHTKGAGMLVVSLRGVNFGFWSHLGSSGQNAIIFSRKLKISFRVAREEILNFFFFQFVLSKGWATPRLVSFGGLIQNVRRAFPPLSYGSLPREHGKQLQEVPVWEKLEKTLLACHFNILWISLITVICMDPHSPNKLIATRSLLQQNIVFSILGDPGAARLGR